MKIHRPRFSIGALLLAITVIALLPAYYVAMNKANRLAAQNADLKKQTGYIEATDPNRLYLRQIRCAFELCWQYRLQTPSDKVWIKVGVFEGETPTDENIKPTGKEYLILPSDALLTLRLIEKEDGRINLRFGNIMADGSGGRLEVPFPIHINFANRVKAWDNHKNATRMMQESETTHGDVQSFATNEFIPLLTIAGEGADKHKKVVIYLELQPPSDNIKAR